MNMNKVLIFATPDHPLYDKLEATSYRFIDLSESNPFEQKRADYLEADIVFELSLLPPEEKYQLLQALSFQLNCPIVSDLTLYWGDWFMRNVPQLKGALSASFYSPVQGMEYCCQSNDIEEKMKELISMIGHHPVKCSTPGVGFHFPRTLAMIINEAYFTRMEGRASEKAIDEAMLYGVNYPLGPFEWCEKIGAGKVVRLLDELSEVTGDPRYRVCPELRLQCDN